MTTPPGSDPYPHPEVDQTDRVLLFRGGDPASPSSGTWWFPPGGGFELVETADEPIVDYRFEVPEFFENEIRCGYIQSGEHRLDQGTVI